MQKLAFCNIHKPKLVHDKQLSKNLVFQKKYQWMYDLKNFKGDGISSWLIVAIRKFES